MVWFARTSQSLARKSPYRLVVQGFIFAEAEQGKTNGLACIAAFAASRLGVRSFIRGVSA